MKLSNIPLVKFMCIELHPISGDPTWGCDPKVENLCLKGSLVVLLGEPLNDSMLNATPECMPIRNSSKWTSLLNFQKALEKTLQVFFFCLSF